MSRFLPACTACPHDPDRAPRCSSAVAPRRRPACERLAPPSSALVATFLAALVLAWLAERRPRSWRAHDGQSVSLRFRSGSVTARNFRRLIQDVHRTTYKVFEVIGFVARALSRACSKPDLHLYCSAARFSGDSAGGSTPTFRTNETAATRIALLGLHNIDPDSTNFHRCYVYGLPGRSDLLAANPYATQNHTDVTGPL